MAVLLTALAASVTGGTLLALEVWGRLTAAWRADLRVVAVLGEVTPPSGIPGVVTAARALPGVAAVRYITADEALAELRRYLGGSGELLQRLPTNPVPARLELTPAARLDAAELRALVQAVGRLPGIAEVQAALGWVEPVERLGRGLRVGGLALGGVLALGALLAVAGATGAARRGRADETAILRLAGARPGVIWAPLLLQALLQGGIGAGLGVGALVLVTQGGVPWVEAWLRAVVGVVTLPPPSWPLAGALVGGGLTLGLIAGLAGGRP